MNPGYGNRGARALALLHDRALRDFVEVWRRFRAAETSLPATEDRSYASPESLLRHVVGAARGYSSWIATSLDLPDPAIDEPPLEDRIESEVDAYLDHLLARFAAPLASLDERAQDCSVHESSWGVPYCIDAMLEHAVMHPVRHGFQLRELLGESPTDAGPGDR